jgi:hypothetical protein
MDAYSVKQESSGKEAEATANDAAATLQQMLASSGALMSPLHFLPAATDGSTASAALPWMMSPYQMMVLPQSFLTQTTTQDGHVLIAPAATSAAGEAMKTDRLNAIGGGQSVAAILQRRAKDVVTGNAASPRPDILSQYLNDGLSTEQVHHDQTARTDVDNLKPPKKPLTPYMTFSKMIWPQVKAANPHLSSVTEIGAVVGAMWRDLDPNEKQRYNEQFNKDKVTYSEELHTYLKTTGLHASDLVKPKAKKKDPRDRSGQSAAASQSHGHHTQQQQQQQHLLSQVSSAASTATTTPVLTSAGQQLIQTLLGLQPGLGSGAGDGATPASIAALSQAWAGQPVQQVLAQMGLSGQTLFANSDGTISVDGSLLTIQGQPVQLAGHVASAAYGDQSQLAASAASVTAASDASAETDQSRPWTWHQPTATAQPDGTAAGSGVVVYQLPAVSGANDTSAAVAASTTSENSQQPTTASLGAQSFYYSIDAYGQLVRHELQPGAAVPQAATTGLTRESQLELEVIHLQNALEVKSREVDELRTQLNEAFATVERLKREAAGESPSGEQSCTSDGITVQAAAASSSPSS